MDLREVADKATGDTHAVRPSILSLLRSTCDPSVGRCDYFAIAFSLAFLICCSYNSLADVITLVLIVFPLLCFTNLCVVVIAKRRLESNRRLDFREGAKVLVPPMVVTFLSAIAFVVFT
ncbi:MAG: hypothetical protein AAFU85_27945, partial [Planctomycetota bacterium]